MRFNIKEMKKQGIFLGILAGFLALIILVSYITSITPAIPTVEETPETSETQNDNKGNKPNKENNSSSTDNKGENKEEHVHNWVKGSTVAPNCTDGGYTINTCFCGENKTTNEKAALGHKLGEWKTEEPDENGDVFAVRSCSACDFTEKKKVEDSGEDPDGETPPTDDPEGEEPEGEEGGEKDPENEGGNQDGNDEENQDPNDDQNGENQN